MKNVFLLIVALLLPLTSYAGWVVTDPGAYTRMAKELEVMKEHVETATKQLEEAQRTVQQLSGNLKRGVGIERDLRKIKKIAADILPSFYNMSVPGGENVDPSDIQWLETQLDDIFTPKNKSPRDRELNKERRGAYTQRSLKAALLESEAAIGSTIASMEKLEQLMREIDETETLKDSQDLSNRLLGEVVATQNKIIILLAQLTRAQSVIHYTGVGRDDGGAKRQITKEEYTRELYSRGSKYWTPKPESLKIWDKFRSDK